MQDSNAGQYQTSEMFVTRMSKAAGTASASYLQDISSDQFVTHGLTPRPGNSNKILFFSFKDSIGRVYEFDFATSTRTLVTINSIATPYYFVCADFYGTTNLYLTGQQSSLNEVFIAKMDISFTLSSFATLSTTDLSVDTATGYQQNVLTSDGATLYLCRSDSRIIEVFSIGTAAMTNIFDQKITYDASYPVGS